MKTRGAWRAWLDAHHAMEPELWLILCKKHAGKTSLAYEEAVQEAKENGQWSRAGAHQPTPDVPSELKKALAQNKVAGRHFENLAPSYRKQFTGWIASIARDDTRRKRVTEAVCLLAENKKLGMK